ncbi:Spt5 C-terminal nonapeptide repeat binding Spt4-domain-containing protein [Apiosordaria backusii]|uniref:Transcription elongation factor SPT5 n=1 Tax=Apiosordaria backusii TaxID=314023 RepID=A0AA40AIY5_9PEZI|nr:Spt5 C-terminal nonapeptide repeat binding Spt4-domain-containing protein [Apiosordaria backusii]
MADNHYGGDSESEDDNFNPAPADLSDEENEAENSSPRVSRKNDHRSSSPVAEEEHDEDEDEDERPSNRTTKRPRIAADDEGGEDEEEEEDEDDEGGGHGDDDEEDEEDEEDEDDEDDVQHRHRRKRRKNAGPNFFDIEAEVDDEDEAEDDERDGEEIEDFIDNAHPDDIADSGGMNDDRRHRDLDRRRELEASLDAEKQAEILRERYGKRAPARGYGDMAVVPKRLLLPSVDDPGIWAVRCKEGKEREVVFSIIRRVEERLGTKNELPITAAFERAGPNSVMKGYVYIEARRQNDILLSLDGILNVYPRTKMDLVPIKDMPDLLRVIKTPSLTPGAWVRMKRPAKHAGDLAQVLDVTENGLEARVRFIPRLDYGVRDDGIGPDGKRKRPGLPGPRPPQRLFSEAEARKKNPRNLQGNPQTNSWTFMGDEFENGFQVRDIKIQLLDVKDVNPTLEEVTRFAGGSEDGTENLDLKALAASLKDSGANVAYVPGDVIEVYEGEQRGVVGKAVDVRGDIVTLRVTEGNLAGQTIEVPNKGLRKMFKLGDHVKVIGGSRFRDEVGMVVKISQDRVTLLTDQTNTEVTVFSKDLRAASDIGGQGSLGQYSLLDLVQLDATTVGCIVKVDRESLGVLDQNGEVRQVMPSQITNKLPKRRTAVAADRSGSEIRLDDVVREYGGQQRQGKILHIHRSFVFLHTNTTNENAGVFVTRAGNVNTIAAKGGRINSQGGPDLSAMNPAMKRNPAENNRMAPPKSFGPDRAINQTVTIRRGGYKGLLGIVKDTTDTHARVELHTKSKIITVPKADLAFKDKVTGKPIDIYSRGGRGGFGGSGRGGYSSGSGRGDWSGGRTPVASATGGRTPAWGAASSSSRTPAWSSNASGARTPAWQDGSRTANPYDGNRTAYGGATAYGGSGGRTPAWNSGSKTPAHDGFGHGSKTPAYGGSGSGDTWGSKTPAYGGGLSAPTPAASGGDWGYTPGPSGHAFDAPTPGAGLSAPTPGALNAPTPGAYTAPTPGPISAPTPGAWQGGWGGDTAPTPAVGAPTPAATGSGYYGAPTPAPYPAETPAGGGYEDDD